MDPRSGSRQDLQILSTKSKQYIRSFQAAYKSAIGLTMPQGYLVQPISTNYSFPTKYLHTLYDVHGCSQIL